MEGPLSRASRLLRWFVRPFAGQEPSFYRAVTACLLASGLFWQMNALNKTYTTRLSFPLRWHYDTARYVPLRPLPEQLPVTVTGRGWRLLRVNLGWGVQPAILRPVTVPGTRYLPAKAWRRGLQTGLEGLEINEWAGDTLRLTFDRYATRRLPLVLRSVTPDSTQAYTARFTPAVLTFRGPSSIISQLPNPYPIVLVGAPADPDENLELVVSPPALVRASARFVSAQVQPHKPDARRGHRNRRGIFN
jgi:hypothetical protein